MHWANLMLSAVVHRHMKTDGKIDVFKMVQKVLKNGGKLMLSTVVQKVKKICVNIDAFNSAVVQTVMKNGKKIGGFCMFQK